MESFHPHFREAFGPAERRSVIEVLDYYESSRTDPPYDGIFQRRFEAEFVEHMGGGSAKAVCTGSVACFIALRALGLPQGSEVLVNGVTDSGSIYSIVESGLVPVVLDTEPNSYRTPPSYFIDAFTRNVSAVFFVHNNGRGSNLKDLRNACDMRGVKLVEDCSQAPFARYCQPECDYKCGTTCKSEFVGVQGHIAAFSTMYRKSLHTGGSGGLVYTRDLDIFSRVIEQSDRGRPKHLESYRDRDPGHSTGPALNFNTDEISCSIGLASLRRIHETNLLRRKFYLELSEQLKNHSDISVDPPSLGDAPFFIQLFVSPKLLEAKASIIATLRNKGLQVSDDYQCAVADWECLETFKHQIIAKENALNVKSLSFNLFFNEKYTVQDAAKVASIVDETVSRLK